MTPTIFKAAYEEAVAAAKWAVSPVNAEAPREQPMSLDCGFAWVEFNPGTHPFIRWCRSNKHGDKHWKRGWQFWSPGQHPGQSVGVHEAGARAFADVLKKHFPEASIYAQSRLD